MEWARPTRRVRGMTLRRWQHWAERKRRLQKRAARHETQRNRSEAQPPVVDRERDLQVISRQVSEAEANIERQRERVFDLRRNGVASHEAESILRSLHLSLLDWRKRLMRQQMQQARTAPRTPEPRPRA